MKTNSKHMDCFVNGHCCYDCPNFEIQMANEKYGYGIADDMGLKEIKCSECCWEKNAECIDCLFANTENCSCNLDGGEI